mmetsp:Transcript_9725/g.28731  ORF Transcript_9725/g.28731 Transcript_9725/m.28731 type:complete len:217 (-) Transcript_9725:355-1005(-)
MAVASAMIDDAPCDGFMAARGGYFTRAPHDHEPHVRVSLPLHELCNVLGPQHMPRPERRRQVILVTPVRVAIPICALHLTPRGGGTAHRRGMRLSGVLVALPAGSGGDAGPVLGNRGAYCRGSRGRITPRTGLVNEELVPPPAHGAPVLPAVLERAAPEDEVETPAARDGHRLVEVATEVQHRPPRAVRREACGRLRSARGEPRKHHLPAITLLHR